ncbi:hypothetical protein [Cellulomonas sp. Leaf334]|uniref:hypothetical protein n=1 Tax=Cellulomonas sp. Leaf334 TaxID=1736339 RepID=UPI000A92812C|nr:hypothetical protein [Cellulomonas sp. Leaf334]
MQRYDSLADLAYFRVASHNSLVRGYFRASSTTFQYGAPGSVAQGSWACHRGKTTGWACGTITSIAYQPPSSMCGGTCSAVFVVVSAASQPGDSGGPWLVGSTPVGIHKGGNSSIAIYSKLSYVNSGVSIWLG